MQITGIIAEYNPFHNGHAFQLARARKETGADYIIVIMSGNFVQRGAPALLDKFVRAERRRFSRRTAANMVLRKRRIFCRCRHQLALSAWMRKYALLWLRDTFFRHLCKNMRHFKR